MIRMICKYMSCWREELLFGVFEHNILACLLSVLLQYRKYVYLKEIVTL